MSNIFLRVPVSGRVRQDDGYAFIEVDPADLDISILKQLWRHEHDRGGTSRYCPDQSIDSLVKWEVSVTELTERLRRVLDDVSRQVRDQGDAGELVDNQLIGKLSRLEQVFESIGQARPGDAEATLVELLYDLMGGLTVIAAELALRSTVASGMEAYGDHVAEKEEKIKEERERIAQEAAAKVAAADSVNFDFYAEWTEAAEGLRHAVLALREMEDSLRPMVSQIQREMEEWRMKLLPGDAEVAEAIRFLNEDFQPKALAFITKGTAEDCAEMADIFKQARDHIDLLDLHEMGAEETRLRLHRSVQSQILPKKAAIASHCAGLSEHGPKLRDFHKKLNSSGCSAPYEFRGEGLITQKEYEEAVVFLRDPLWSPLNAKHRLDGLIARATSLVRDQLKLPHDEVRSHIEAAQTFFSDVDRTMTELSSDLEAASAEPAEDASPAGLEPATVGEAEQEAGQENSLESDTPTVFHPQETEAGGSDPPLLQPCVSTDSQRAAELYNLVICVGYVLTCKTTFLAASTIKALLDVLPFLDIATEAEIAQHRAEVLRLSHRAEQRETVTDRKKATDRWRRTDCRWISYSPRGKQWRLKLAEKSGPLAVRLMTKHGLTRDGIKDAHRRKKEAQREAHLERKRLAAAEKNEENKAG